MDFRILGSLEVHEDGHAIELGSGRQRALLAVLLLHANELVLTDRLIDELWGEQAPPTAPKIIQNYVSQLRRALGATRLVTRAHGYILEVAPGALDLNEFESLVREGSAARTGGDNRTAARKLREALSLWRGTPLAEFAYEPFAQEAIARLEEQRLAATEERIDADLALRQHAELVGELEELVRRSPLRERLRAQLMLALYRSGRQAEALQAFREARQVLVDELGIEPSDELHALHRAILEHDPALSAPVAIEEPQPGGAAAPSASAVQPVSFLRRPRLLVLLGAALVSGAAAAGVVALTGNSAKHAEVVAPNSVAVVDPQSGRIVKQVRVGSLPVAIAVGPDGVWVANSEDGTVSRLDPKTGRVVATIGTGEPATDIADGAGSVWVANGSEGTLTRIDPRSNTVVDTIDLRGPDKLVPEGVYAVTVGAGRVWVASGSGSIVKIDPATGMRTRIPVGLTPADIDFSGGNLWVARIGGRVLRIDAGIDKETGAATAAPNARAIAVGLGGVWVTDARLGDEGLLWWIDPATLVPQGIASLRHVPGGLATGGGAVWVAGGLSGTLIKIDPSTGQPSRLIPLGNAPLDVAYGAGAVWVTVGTRAAAATW